MAAATAGKEQETAASGRRLRPAACLVFGA